MEERVKQGVGMGDSSFAEIQGSFAEIQGFFLGFCGNVALVGVSAADWDSVVCV